MTNNLPLASLKVLDLSRILAGPYAAQVMGDLGAHVIKIEKAKSGDDTRTWGPPFIQNDKSKKKSAAYFYAANRNKKSLGLDLKNKEDREFLNQLIKQADVLIQNFKLKTLDKLQLTYDNVKAINPKLIYCSITSFGSSGPYKDHVGYDALIQAMGGLMSVTGGEDGNTPTRTGVAITDITTGLYSVIGILAALRERDQSGQGQHLELSLFDTQVSWLANVGMNYLVTNEVPKAYGTAHPNIVPYQAFDCLDGKVYIAIGNDQQFETFSKVLKQNWHEDELYQTNALRVENRSSLVANIQAVLKDIKRNDCLKTLNDNGLAAGPVNNLKDLKNDPQAIHNKLFTSMSDSDVPCLKSPMNFSRTPIQEYKSPAAELEESHFDFESF